MSPLFRSAVLSLMLVAGSGPPTGAQSPDPVGRYRALVVFVRFQEDSLVWDGCTPASHNWDVPDRLPRIGSRLLSPTPEPPFPVESLTAFFYQQSAGRFVLFGDVYPEVVVARLDPAAAAYTLAGLTRSILTEIDDDPRVDLSAYDHDADGFLDHIFFILRSDPVGLFPGGVAGVSVIGYSSDEPEFGSDPTDLKRLDKSASGSYVIYQRPGNIYPDLYLVRTMAHEIGHDLWDSRVHGHLYPYIPTPNAGNGRGSALGYALMVGEGDTRGDVIISAYERDLLDADWISCAELGRDTTVVVGDLYDADSQSCYVVAGPLDGRNPSTLYVSSRQRLGYFDRLRVNPCTETPSCHGLMETGLLIMNAGPLRGARVSVVPADGDLCLGVSTDSYRGDLFKPGTKTQLTPWTSPRIFARMDLPSYLPTPDAYFQAIDNIRYTGSPDLEMAFDFVADFRKRPVIREDSRIGLETAGYHFKGPVLVTNRATLTIATDLTFDSLLTVEAGASLVIGEKGILRLGPDGQLVLEPGSCLVVRGELDSGGQVVPLPCSGCGAPLCTPIPGSDTSEKTLLQAYPNPFRDHLTVEFALNRAEGVRLDVVDLLGRPVATLLDDVIPPGAFTAAWQPRYAIPGGAYRLRLVTGTRVESLQVVRVP